MNETNSREIKKNNDAAKRSLKVQQKKKESWKEKQKKKTLWKDSQVGTATRRFTNDEEKIKLDFKRNKQKITKTRKQSSR